MSNSNPIMNRGRVQWGASWFAVLWTLGVASFLLYGPVYNSTATVTADHTLDPATAGSVGLAAVEGWWAYLVVVVPVVLAAAPLVARQRGPRVGLTLLVAVLLAGLVVLSIASVGLLYAPAVGGLGLAALAGRRSRAAA